MMDFLYEKQNRRYFGALAVFCIFMMFFAVMAGKVQAQGMKNVLLERERAVVSSLLAQGVSPNVVAAAYKNEAVTEEGMTFLEKIGWSPDSDPGILPSVKKQAKAAALFGLSAAVGLGAALLGGSAAFLKKRERIYQEAEAVIAEFASGNFSRHLCRDQEGMLYQMFAAVDELAKALQAKGEMALRAKQDLQDAVSDISHQLKTPLAALGMYAEIILEEPDKPETVEEFARRSLQSVARIEQLIGALLKVMRLDAGSIVFEKKRQPVSELARAAAEELHTRAKKEKKRILIQGDPGAFLECDLTWTAEALSNLIKNALDHTETGGVIRIGWRQAPALLRLWVEDDGCGIAPEDMPHIFKRFYRSRQSADAQGAGLGLALAKSIVEKQGGVLSVDSRPGEGSVFMITFS